MDTTARVNGNISFWYADIGGIPAYRAALPGNITADVCIVGAGAIDDDKLTEFYCQRLLVPKVNPNSLARLAPSFV